MGNQVQYGSHGIDVEKLQEALNKVGSSANDYKIEDITYDPYQKGESVLAAEKAVSDHTATKPVEHNSTWDQTLQDVYDKIANREKFSYDLNGDALYQQYKDKYIKQGKMAMGDAIGQASAMTGGYGNSYAQSVGQQAYQAQLENLNDIVPELYQMAYDQYNREGQDLLDQFSMAGAMSDRDYNRYRDSVTDYYAELDYLTGRADKELAHDYSKYIDGRDFYYNEENNKRNLGYAIHRDKTEDDQWERQFAHGVEQDRISNEQWQKDFDYTAAQDSLDRTESNAKTYYETGGKVGYDNGSVSPEGIKAMQEALGITADGKWGSGSKEASDGLTADQAWKAYQSGKLGKVSIKEIRSDLDLYISQGVSKSEINTYLREALQDKHITQAEYNELKAIYAPRGYTYGTGNSGNRYNSLK